MELGGQAGLAAGHAVGVEASGRGLDGLADELFEGVGLG
jgi:hypothetical protein